MQFIEFVFRLSDAFRIYSIQFGSTESAWKVQVQGKWLSGLGLAACSLLEILGELGSRLQTNLPFGKKKRGGEQRELQIYESETLVLNAMSWSTMKCSKILGQFTPKETGLKSCGLALELTPVNVIHFHFLGRCFLLNFFLKESE